ncbi:RimK family alpha-L-glutamate ligase [Bacteroidota bacterium]
MNSFDLAIAYKWVHDRELTDQIEEKFHKNGLTTFVIGKHNVHEITDLVKNRKLAFQVYFDRASDEDEDFETIANILTRRKTYIINNYQKVEIAIDKSIMHNKLIKHNFNLPGTIIIPPFDDTENITINDGQLSELGSPFIIKPAYYSGAGEGVVTNATSVEQILTERKKKSDDHYLVQQKIYPKLYKGKRTWFRSYYFFNDVYPVWWDDLSHSYEMIGYLEFKKLKLNDLINITYKLAAITGLDYFSSEIALSDVNKFILIDYVNDQCDFRKKSKFNDGVPDEIVDIFITEMMNKVNQTKK